MSLINFGAGNSQQGVFSRIKPYPTPNIQGILSNDSPIPTVRSGNKNYFQPVLYSSGHADTNRYMRLQTTNPIAMVTEVDFNSITAGCRWKALCISSTDMCMYAIAIGTDTLIRLIKISDTTGAVTEIGSGFAADVGSDWSQYSTLEDLGTTLIFKAQSSTYNVIDKATGTSITQNTAFGITNAKFTGATYTSLDGTIVAGSLYHLSTVAYNYQMFTPIVAHAGVGVVRELGVSYETVFGTHQNGGGSTAYTYGLVMVDNDKLAIVGNIAGVNPPVHITTRQSYDAFLQSIVNYAAGL